MAALCRANISTQTALVSLIESGSRDSPLTRAGEDIRRNLAAGATLAESMAAHPRVFNRLYTGLVRCGENAGQLGVALTRLLELLERERDHGRLRAELLRAMANPFIPLASILLWPSIFVLMSPIPWLQKVVPFFLLPFMTAWRPALVLFVIWLILQIRVIRLRWDRMVLGLPYFGPLLTQLLVLRFVWRLDDAYGAGLPAADALSLIAPGIGNAYVTREIEVIAGSVRSGAGLAQALAGSKFFPGFLKEIFAGAETVGHIGDSLATLSRQLPNEIRPRITNARANMRITTIILVVLAVSAVAAALLLQI